jgi:hypothetical protein
MKDSIYGTPNNPPIPDNSNAYKEGYQYVECDHCMDIGPNEIRAINQTTNPPTDIIINTQTIYNNNKPHIQDNSSAFKEGYQYIECDNCRE